MTQSPINEPVLFRGNIHWYAYAKPVLQAILAFLIIGIIGVYFEGRFVEVRWGIGLLAVLWLTYSVLRIQQIQWTITQRRLLISGGLLPWQKYDYHLTPHQIFEAFANQTLTGRALNFGTVVIRKSDGVGSTLTEAFMSSPRKFAANINQWLETAHQSTAAPQPSSNVSSSAIEQLEKLVAMKNGGLISEEEFLRMKAKIING